MLRKKIADILIPELYGRTDIKDLDKHIMHLTDELLKALSTIVLAEKKDLSKGNGKGCKCYASYYGECGCQDVDWSDRREYNTAIDHISQLILGEKGGGINGKENL